MFRRMPNGDVIFPNKGKIPLDMIGFVRDSGDPYLFHPDFPNNCIFREFKSILLPCGKKSSNSFFCSQLKQVVIPYHCENCKIRKE